MCADEGPIRCDREQAVVEFVGFPVLFGTGKEQGHAQSGGESGHVRHPRVGLWQNPFRPDAVGKGIAGDNEFGSDDPCRAESCGGGDCRLDKSPVPCKVARDRREVEQRDAQCVWWHTLELSGWSAHGCNALEGNIGGRTRATRNQRRHLLDKGRNGKNSVAASGELSPRPLVAFFGKE